MNALKVYCYKCEFHDSSTFNFLREIWDFLCWRQLPRRENCLHKSNGKPGEDDYVNGPLPMGLLYSPFYLNKDGKCENYTPIGNRNFLDRILFQHPDKLSKNILRGGYELRKNTI